MTNFGEFLMLSTIKVALKNVLIGLHEIKGDSLEEDISNR